MTEQYRQFRMPLSAYQKFLEKRNKIEDKLFSISRKKIRVPLTKMISIIANRQIFIEDEALMQEFLQRKKMIRGGNAGGFKV